jgi:CheY-like chemotaxis protein
MAQDTEKNEQGERASVKMILLIEDDANIGEVLLQAIAQETPYLATLVTNGFEALKAVEGIKPDLFILDYLLPRMNGVELYDRLHAIPELAQVPALMISARLPGHDLAPRTIRTMNKPIELDDFLQAIDELLT